MPLLKILFLTFAASILVVKANANEEPPEITSEPDFYNAPGVNENRAYDSNENIMIDTFSGTMQAHYTDLVVPGQAGFDIVINRSFNSGSRNYNIQNYAGSRWSIHFGKLDKAGYQCDPEDGVLTFIGKGVFIKPDGGVEAILRRPALFLDDNQNGEYDPNDEYKPTLITPSLWRAECQGEDLVITDTQGTDYYIGHGDVGWHVVRVEDKNGNYYEIDYIGEDYDIRPKEVRASDGRTVSFIYGVSQHEKDDIDYDATVLTSIHYGGKEIRYDIELYDSHSTRLNSVRRPDGALWEYTYVEDDAWNGVKGVIKTIKSPYGLESSFQYDKLNHLGNDYAVVKQKCRDTQCWDYSYSPAKVFDEDNRRYDITTITGPDGIKTYKHYGFFSADRHNYYDPDTNIWFNYSSVWQVGLLKSLTHEVDDEIIYQEDNEWDSSLVANISRGFTFKDTLSISEGVYRQPVLVKKTVTQDNKTSTYSVLRKNYVGWPELVKEEGNKALYKETEYTVIGEENGHWILKLPVKTSVGYSESDLKQVTVNGYDSRGRLTRTISKGVDEKYQYYSSGNLKSTEDGVGNITNYSDYSRGIAKRVDYPDGGYITRSVDSYGRVKSETNANNVTTYYSYDLMDRLIEINNPFTEDVSVDYMNAGKTVTHTRGSLKQTNQYNKKMLLINKVIEDSVSGKQFIENYEYDEFDRLVFKSRINETEKGVIYKYDPLHRMIQSETTDGRITKIDYVDGETRVVTNPNGVQSTYKYDTYSPSNKLLSRIEAPEGVVVDLTYNELGQPLTVTQDNVVREYGYNDNWQLNYYKEPEKDGQMTYSYDASGRKEASYHWLEPGKMYVTNYEYDELGRLIKTHYPGFFYPIGESDKPSYENSCQKEREITCNYIYEATSIVNEYDLLGQLINKERIQKKKITKVKPWFDEYTLTESNSWAFKYDDEGRLLEEKFSNAIGDNLESYKLRYAYNSLDNLSTITYPSNFVVNYNPDAFGRPTQVGNIVTSVDYYDSGSIKQLVYGNGHLTNYSLNEQLLPESMTIGSSNTDIVNYSYSYDYVGNLETLTDNLNSSKSINMAYDDLDRLVTANGSWGTGSFQYDQLGNIEQKTIGTVTKFYSYDTRNRLDNFAGFDFSYDLSGRVKDDGKKGYFYDHTGSLIKASGYEGTSAQVRMEYDANNRLHRRIQKDAPGATPNIKTVLYSQAGQLMHEIRTSGDFKRDHIYLGNKLVGYHDDKVDCFEDFDGDGMQHCYERKNGLDPYTDDAHLDKDDDGLTNLEEYQIGSRADIADTDGDGIPDGFEALHGLNPLVADSELDGDNDGFSNYDEYLYGLNPSVFDELPEISEIVAAGDQEHIVVAWEPSRLVKNYRLYWSESPNIDINTSNVIELTEGLYYHKVPEKGQKYYYKAVAYNQAQETEPSVEVNGVAGRHGWTDVADVSEAPRSSAVDLKGNVYAIYLNQNTNNNSSNIVIKYFTPQSVTSDEFVLNGLYNKVQMAATAQGYIYAIFTGENYHIKVYDPVSNSWHEHDKYRELDGAEELRVSRWSYHDNGNFAYIEQKWHPDHQYPVNLKSKVFRFIPEMGWSEAYSLDYTEEESEYFHDGTYDFYADDISINQHGNIALTWPKDWSEERTDEESEYAIKGFDSLHLATIDVDGNVNKTFIGNTKLSGGSSKLWFDDANAGTIVWRRIEDDNTASTLFSQKFDLNGLSGDKATIASRTSERYGGFDVQLLPSNQTLLYLDEPDHTKVYLEDNNVWSAPQILNYSINWSRSGSFKSNAGWPQSLLMDESYNIHHVLYTPEGEFKEIDFITELTKFSNISVAGQLAQWIRVPGEEEFDPVIGEYVQVTPDKVTLLVRNVTELSAINMPPVANAGADITADEFTTISLDGSLSTDSDGHIAKYDWKVVSGKYKVDITESDTPSPEVKLSPVNDNTEVKVRLKVTDNAGVSHTDDVIITITDTGNVPPVTETGDDFSAMEGEIVHLDLMDSYDPDGDGSLSYSWGVISGGYLPIEQAPGGGLQFIAPSVDADKDYTLRLTVTDPEGGSSSDTVTITIIDSGESPGGDNDAPIADAGPDQSFDEDSIVILDGSNSYDPNGSPISMEWNVISGGPLQLSEGPTPGTVDFLAPEVSQATDFVIRLTVTNAEGLSSSDDVVITVLDTDGGGGDPSNLPPVADAGLDQVVNEETVVILDGRNSYDPEGAPLNLSWSVISGGSLQLEQGPEPGTLQFTAPNITPTGDYVLRLTVTDPSGATDTDEMTVTVTDLDGGPVSNNQPPVANAGPDQVVTEGDTVIIDPRSSYDPDGYSLNLGISIVSGGYLPLESGAEQGTFQFVAPDVDSESIYTLRITVTDADGASDSDDINVTVTPQ